MSFHLPRRSKFRNEVAEPIRRHRWMIQHEIVNVSPEEMQKRWEAMASTGDSGRAEGEK